MLVQVFKLPHFVVISHTQCLYRLSDESGAMEFTLVKEGTIPRACFDPMDGTSFGIVISSVIPLCVSQLPIPVFIADTGKAVYVWIGSGASCDEKKHAMIYAHVSNCGPNYIA